MRKHKITKIVFIIGLILFYGYGSLFFNNVKQREIVYADSNNCMDSFMLQNANLNDSRFLAALDTNAKSDIFQYFTCVALANKGTSPCNSLKSPFAQTCLEYSNTYNFLEDLLALHGSGLSASPKIIKQCMREFDTNKELCENLLNAMSKTDQSRCNNPVFGKDKVLCEAFVTLNANSLQNREDKDLVLFLSAIKSLSAEKCSGISNKNFKVACEALVVSDEKVCRKCGGFKELTNIFCKELQAFKGGDNEKSRKAGTAEIKERD